MSYKIDIKSKFVIYGTGRRGISVAKNLLQREYTIDSFCDIKADEIKNIKVMNRQIPVHTQSQLTSRNDIIVIALQDTTKHDEIVQELLQVGFARVIYFPMSILGIKDNIVLMRNLYTGILSADYDKRIFEKDIPNVNEIIRRTTVFEETVIYVPVELLFATNIEDVDRCDKPISFDERSYDNVIDFYGENIVNLYYYKKLWNYFDGAMIEDRERFEREMQYVTKRRVNVDSNNDFFINRYLLFQKYEKALSVDRDFFEQSAISVTWNSKGMFNISDGHHRATYLIHKGIYNIPTLICKEDRNKLRKLIEYNGISYFESPNTIHDEQSEEYHRQLITLAPFLRRRSVLNARIYVDMNDSGYFARYVYRLNCKYCVDVEREKEKRKQAHDLCEIFGFRNNRMIITVENNEIDKEWDIGIVDDCFLKECIKKTYKMYLLIRTQNSYKTRRLLEENNYDIETIGNGFLERMRQTYIIAKHRND